VFLAAIALVLDYHLALWYALAFLVIYVIAQQPACGGLGTSSHLTPLQLETLLTEGKVSNFGWWNSVLCQLPVVSEQVPFFLNSQLHSQPKIYHLGQLILDSFQMRLRSSELPS
ncbi:hypothetical protein C2S51_038626, partial [Perilla frutescens var. frutescens]